MKIQNEIANLLDMVIRNCGFECELTIKVCRAAENGATLDALQEMITSYFDEEDEDEDEEP